MSGQTWDPFIFTCIHCGQKVNRDGETLLGQTTCGESTADWDMQDQPHDFDLDLAGEPL